MLITGEMNEETKEKMKDLISIAPWTSLDMKSDNDDENN